MKKVLSVLLSFVFFEVQALAMHGPELGAGQLGIQGTYAGALLPTGNATDAAGVNGLGLFSLSVPATGLGMGSFVYFQAGQTFVGTITAVANPDEDTLVGLVEGSFTVTTASTNFTDTLFLDTGGISSSQTVAVVSGEIQAAFSEDTFGVSGTLLNGTATVEISIPPTTSTNTTTDAAGNTTTSTSTSGSLITSSLTLVVDGFQQSTATGQTTDLTSLGTSTTGTGTTTGS